jgi:hypothetical protein
MTSVSREVAIICQIRLAPVKPAVKPFRTGHFEKPV